MGPVEKVVLAYSADASSMSSETIEHSDYVQGKARTLLLSLIATKIFGAVYHN